MSRGKDMGSSLCSSKCLGASIRKFNSVTGNKREKYNKALNNLLMFQKRRKAYG